MDKLYVGDIPKDYHYAVFSDNHIDLYNQNIAQNIDLPYYRIYLNYPSFVYSRGINHFGAYSSTTFQNIEVTDKWYYRKDSFNILFFSLCFIIGTLWIINLFTSIFKKGGLLSGLF